MPYSLRPPAEMKKTRRMVGSACIRTTVAARSASPSLAPLASATPAMARAAASPSNTRRRPASRSASSVSRGAATARTSRNSTNAAAAHVARLKSVRFGSIASSPELSSVG